MENIDIDIDKDNLKNIDIDIDINMAILENIDIDKGILQNIDIDKISNRFKFGISNRASQRRQSESLGSNDWLFKHNFCLIVPVGPSCYCHDNHKAFTFSQVILTTGNQV